jgi:hypothetical protein
MSDEAVIDAFMNAASPMIEDLVTRSIGKGRVLGEMAIVLERHLDGQARAACVDRLEVVRVLRADKRLTPNSCQHIEEAMNAAKANELPIVLLLQERDGLLGGIRLVTGGIVGTS